MGWQPGAVHVEKGLINNQEETRCYSQVVELAVLLNLSGLRLPSSDKFDSEQAKLCPPEQLCPRLHEVNAVRVCPTKMLRILCIGRLAPDSNV